MSSSHRMRQPHSMPSNVGQNYHALQVQGEMGRGRGAPFVSAGQPMGRGAMAVNQEAAVRSIPKSVPGATQKALELENAQKPYNEYEKQKQILDQYIPGLHRPGIDYPELPTIRPRKQNPIPESLVSDFHSGRKNAVMVIHEYGSILKIPVDFTEVAVKNKPVFSGAFACECKVGNKTYYQGVGKTKKDAKKEAARIAFEAILQSYDDDNCDVASEPVAEDSEPVTDASVDTHGLGNKNPVMMLYEYCAKKNWKVSVQMDDKTSDDGFHCVFLVNNEPVGKGVALNKKDAKTNAGSEALRKLLSSETVSNTHWDQIAKLAHDFAERLFSSQLPHYSWNVLAAFVLKRSQEDPGTVIALGTGDACLSLQKSQDDSMEEVNLAVGRMRLDDVNVASAQMQNPTVQPDGMVLFDSHAEVVARRALKKWFYQQIRMLYESEDTNPSVFEWNPQTNKVRLKETVSIHMYISTAPCGDASAFPSEESTIITAEERQVIDKGLHMPTFNDPNNHGRLRVKCEIGLTSIPLDRVEGSGSQRLRTMSCSSKILKWNVLGLQGSLLSQYVEPVYMSSLTLGNKFCHGHVVRAICCRLPDTINGQLPVGYSLRHPYVGRVSVYAPAKAGSEGMSQNLSINWCIEDQFVEVVDARVGLSTPESPFHTNAGPFGRASRLCKFGFHFRFKQLSDKTGNPQLVDGCPTYLDKKRAATDYQAAKQQLWRQLESDGYGCWLTKPEKLEQFV